MGKKSNRKKQVISKNMQIATTNAGEKGKNSVETHNINEEEKKENISNISNNQSSLKNEGKSILGEKLQLLKVEPKIETPNTDENKSNSKILFKRKLNSEQNATLSNASVQESGSVSVKSMKEIVDEINNISQYEFTSKSYENDHTTRNNLSTDVLKGTCDEKHSENDYGQEIFFDDPNFSDFIDDTVLISKETNLKLDQTFLGNCEGLNMEEHKIEEYSELEKNLSRISDDNSVVNDPSLVYVKSILELFKNINTKLTALDEKKTNEQKILEECYKMASVKDANIKSFLGKHIEKVDKEEVTKFFVLNKVPRELTEILTQKVKIYKMFVNYKGKINEMCNVFELLKREKERLVHENIKIQEEGENVCRSLLEDENKHKESLLKIIRKEDSETCAEDKSYLKNDLISALENIVETKNSCIEKKEKDILRLKEEQNALKLQLQEMKDQKEVVAEHTVRIRKLQNDNIFLSQKTNKLTEENIKYQKDLVMFNTEIKKLLGSDKIKTETIMRQKRLIEMYQKQLCGTNTLTDAFAKIEKLKENKVMLDERLKKEENAERKRVLQKQKDDCEKRLSDLLKYN